MILKSGIHFNIPSNVYHAGVTEGPALSSSIGKILWDKPPIKAKEAHSVLNPNWEQKYSDTFDLGNSAHSRFLEGDESKYCIIDAKDWRTNIAKEARVEAREQGLVPILKHKYPEIVDMTDCGREQLKQTEQVELIEILENGTPETTLTYFENGFHYKSRLDWLSNDRSVIFDYKTTKTIDLPFITKQIHSLNYDLSAHFYKWINWKTGGPEIEKQEFFFVYQQASKPYTLITVGLDGQSKEYGQMKFEYVNDIWKKCITDNSWPGYSKKAYFLSPPGWAGKEVEEKTYTEVGEEIKDVPF